MATKFTNKHNLPSSIVRAVENDTHRTNGDISVTTLIDAPQIRMLKRANTITEDVMDRVWALYGTAMHHILERGEIASTKANQLIEASGVLSLIAEEDGDERMKKASEYVEKVAREKFPNAFNNDVITEKTLTITVDGMAISGTFDRFIISEEKLQDYKNTSVYEYIYPEARKKRYAQFNIYAAMLREHGYKVSKAELIYIFRDWSRSEAKKGMNRDYPDTPIKCIDTVPMMEHAYVMNYIKERVRVHQAAENGEQVLCTAKERWSTADTYAVKVKGGKRALPGSIVPTIELAENYIKANGHKYHNPYIETRPGEDRRCAEFCSVKDFCQQRKDRLAQAAEETLD